MPNSAPIDQSRHSNMSDVTEFEKMASSGEDAVARLSKDTVFSDFKSFEALGIYIAKISLSSASEGLALSRTSTACTEISPSPTERSCIA